MSIWSAFTKSIENLIDVSRTVTSSLFPPSGQRPFSDIPDDVLNLIFAKLDFASQASMSFVNRRSRKLIKIEEMRVCPAAAYYGYMKLLQWARENHFPWGKNNFSIDPENLANKKPSSDLFEVIDTCSSASLAGRLKILQWAKEQGCPLTGRTIEMAGAGNHSHILKWAKENDCPESYHILHVAYCFGQIEFVKRMSAVDSWIPNVCSTAAYKGDLSFLEWARSTGKSLGNTLCEQAARGGHMNVLAFAHDIGCPWGDSVKNAAQNGHIHILKWLYDKGCSYTAEVYAHVLGGGYNDETYQRNVILPLLQWLYELNIPFSIELPQISLRGAPLFLPLVIQRRYLIVLEWLPEIHLPYLRKVLCKLAVEYGSLEILQWARARAYPWDAELALQALNSHTDMFLWVVNNGCPWDQKVCDKIERRESIWLLLWLAKKVTTLRQNSIFIICHNKSFEDLQKMHAEGIPAQFLIGEETLCDGRLEVLEWALSKGAKLLPFHCAIAAGLGNLPLLQWLRKHEAPYDSLTCTLARLNELTDLLEWALADGAPSSQYMPSGDAEEGDFELSINVTKRRSLKR
ncbi:MAG: F-box protein [Parachlamydia sp.]|nr:F-box protein [Parachlamydia sp.]